MSRPAFEELSSYTSSSVCVCFRDGLHHCLFVVNRLVSLTSCGDVGCTDYAEGRWCSALLKYFQNICQHTTNFRTILKSRPQKRFIVTNLAWSQSYHIYYYYIGQI